MDGVPDEDDDLLLLLLLSNVVDEEEEEEEEEEEGEPHGKCTTCLLNMLFSSLSSSS